MINKKNKINIPLILCTVFIAVISCFACFSFNKSNNTAYADSVSTSYKFVASDLYNIDYYTSGSGSNYSLYPCLFSSNIYYESGSDSVVLTPFFNFCSINGSSLTYTRCNLFSSDGSVRSDFTVSRGSNFGLYFAQYYNGITAGNYFYVDGYCDAEFNANVYKVSLYLSEAAFTENASAIGKFLIISYYDEFDNHLSFAFNVPDNYLFNTRTYFINIDFTDSQIYNQGYQEGLIANQDNVYNAGYRAGETVGYGAGYNAGLEDTNQYTFTNLIGAVVDVPVKYFTSLFDFELLGFNLKSLLMGLFTLCVISTIVKFCLGGK